MCAWTGEGDGALLRNEMLDEGWNEILDEGWNEMLDVSVFHEEV